MNRKTWVSLCLLLLVLALAMPVHAQTQATATVTARRASVWAGPGRGFWWIGFLNRNDTAVITGISADKQWWQVNTQFGVGYLWYLDVTTSNTDGVPTANPGVYGTITAGRVIVHVAPGIGAQAQGMISHGMQFYVIGTRPDGRWLQIQYQFGKGWIAASLTSLRNTVVTTGQSGTTATGTPIAPVTSAGPRAIINTGALNVRTGPGFGFARLGVLHGGEVVPIIGRTQDGTWLQVHTSFGDGWVNIIYVITQDYFGSAPVTSSQAAGAPTEALFVVLGGSANVRSGPAVGFTVLFGVDAGMQFSIIGQNQARTWWYIDTPWGKGWINKQLGQATGAVDQVPVVEVTQTVTQ